MGQRHQPGQMQSQAHAACDTLARGVSAIKGLTQLRQMGRINARPMVTHRHLHSLRCSPHRDLRPHLTGSVAQGVVQQIAHGQTHPRGVDINGGQVRW